MRPTVINSSGGLSGANISTRDRLLDLVFDDAELKNKLTDTLNEQGAGIENIDDFVRVVKSTLVEWAGERSLPDPQTQIERIDQFAYETEWALDRYDKQTKQNPNAVFWPDPTRGGEALDAVLPWAQRPSFLDQSTAIGSAGSCFAIEIAQNLLQRGFNYLCLENDFDPATGVHMAGADPQNPKVQFSCRWGILFNTPSFTQVVENAFGERQLEKLVIKHECGLFFDPYRESVFFPSLEAYEVERERHLANTRHVFQTADVFIITLGLNEAWQYVPDGTFISRNPRNPNLRGFLRHRTLSVQDNIDYLQRFIDIVRHHNPDLKLVISVSPVPFLATGRANEEHVVSANCHSKSVLRVAADEIVRRNEDVFYFPSFEVVTTCSKYIWAEDQRHVHPSAVARVMELFDTMFLTNSTRTLMRLQKQEAKNQARSVEKNG